MHGDLSRFLDEIWRDASSLLLTAAVNADDTVNQRLYEKYNKGTSPTARLSHLVQYSHLRVQEGVRRRAPCWYEYTRFGSTSYSHRIFINAKPEYAPLVFLTVVNRWRLPPHDFSIRPSLSAPAPATPVDRPVFGIKVADEIEVRTGRADVIVVYVQDRTAAGRVVAALEGDLRQQQVVRVLRDIFNPQTPRLTERSHVAGISYGVQPEKGASFGEVRCDLIARALAMTLYPKGLVDVGPIVPVKVALGRDEITGLLSDPMRAAIAKSAFVQRTIGLFSDAGIDPEAPWR